MIRILESSMERHLETFRRDLTLDLFTRHGSIWALVSRARRRWEIEPEARIPPAPEFKHVHLPKFLLNTSRPEWPIEAEEDYIRWMVYLERMHHELIPPDLRVEDVRFDSADFWDGFLSACILYDPPPDDLLGFADHPITSYGMFRSSQDSTPEAGDDTLQMLAPPIQDLYDSNELRAWERGRQTRLLEELHRRLEPRGIDLLEMVYHLEYFDAAIKGDPQDEPKSRPFIQVKAHTTEVDVRHAYRLLISQQPDRPRAIKPKRDTLTSVQCAVWYDDLDWSHEQIAERFGWSVQHPAGCKPKSEAARRHIAVGRDVLNHRKVAA